ncbi:MAG: potassium channel protein [Dehalococcoidia bacterium]
MRGRVLSARLPLAAAAIAVIYAIGVAWFYLVEGWTLLEAAFMVMHTVTTVGFGEVRPLDTSARIFLLGFIPVGVGAVLYTVGLLVEDVVIREVADTFGLQRQTRRIRNMRDHVVICGYGRVGMEVAAELRAHANDVLVIELDPDRLAVARSQGLVGLEGDATEEAVLREANVEVARALIAAADSDTGNAFIVLTGRALNPDLLIIARSGSESAERRLRTAGADRVISPTQIAGRRMALAAVQPLMVDFLDTLSRQGANHALLAEFVIDAATAHLADLTLGEAFEGLQTCRVLAIERADGNLVVGPDGSAILQPGDRLIIHGQAADLERLRAARGAAVG